MFRFVSSVVFTLAALPVSAQMADSVCMSDVELEAALIDWYGERPIQGTERRDAQIWASEHTGTWTLVRYFVDGQACVAAQGDGWEDRDALPQQVAALID